LLTPMTLAMSGFMAFSMASATFRVFKARNVEAALLLIAGILVMLKNAPVGSLIWSGFQPIGVWLMQYIGGGPRRGILIGSAIAAVFFGIRVLLGFETRWLGGTKE